MEQRPLMLFGDQCLRRNSSWMFMEWIASDHRDSNITVIDKRLKKSTKMGNDSMPSLLRMWLLFAIYTPFSGYACQCPQAAIPADWATLCMAEHSKAGTGSERPSSQTQHGIQW